MSYIIKKIVLLYKFNYGDGNYIIKRENFRIIKFIMQNEENQDKIMKIEIFGYMILFSNDN